MDNSFIPKGQEGLLLRDPLTFGFSAPSGSKEYKPIYSQQHDHSHKLNKGDRDTLHSGGFPKKVGFYTRHNPHPVRVRHMKGLLDTPICYIEDNTEPRYLMSAPSGQDYRQQFYPAGSTRFSARGDLPPAVGVVPVTYAWRDELEKKASNAIHRALGQSPPSRGAGTGTRNTVTHFDHMDDSKLLDLLCQILQTDSIPACQAWLRAASNSEKTIVLNMIRMAAGGDFPAHSAKKRPHSNDSDVRYIWAPDKSQSTTRQLYTNTTDDPYQDEEEEFKFSYQEKSNEENKYGLYDTDDSVPFKLPDNDTVIKTARQLSNLASRQGSRCGTAGSMFRGLSAKDPLSPSRKAQQAMAENLSKTTSEQLQSYLQKHSREKHSRSASLSGPVATRPMVKRPRSRSANTAGSTAAANHPPAPVKLIVTKERLRDNGGGSRQGTGKLQYTSHCMASQ